MAAPAGWATEENEQGVAESNCVSYRNPPGWKIDTLQFHPQASMY
ncbi:c-C motif chemokine 25-like protein [Corchorus olitorius]|uniref:C-C motif chemokine 25-like protein n=1 Tax=Corchorus olitorius TaxID=93759 RepID=A0A1R3L007_9ROSI|nr:c-C motif chemokine 25-like protein [Corchorus olitorius]